MSVVQLLSRCVIERVSVDQHNEHAPSLDGPMLLNETQYQNLAWRVGQPLGLNLRVPDPSRCSRGGGFGSSLRLQTIGADRDENVWVPEQCRATASSNSPKTANSCGTSVIADPWIAADSKGNVYAGEVEDGKRIQKFVPAK